GVARVRSADCLCGEWRSGSAPALGAGGRGFESLLPDAPGPGGRPGRQPRTGPAPGRPGWRRPGPGTADCRSRPSARPARGCSSMAELQPSKLAVRVRFPSPARSGPRGPDPDGTGVPRTRTRSEEHTSELQSRENLVCRLLLETT